MSRPIPERLATLEVDLSALRASSPTGWVDPMTPADWKAWADHGQALRDREARRLREAPASPPPAEEQRARPVTRVRAKARRVTRRRRQ